MVQFARQILQDTVTIVKRLERVYGPGTGDMRLCVGMSSGPVMAGVTNEEAVDPDKRANNPELAQRLRHLLGPTVRKAAQLEAMSSKHRILISSSTATLLQSAGKKS